MDAPGGACSECRRDQLGSPCCRVGLVRRGTRIRRRPAAGDAAADRLSALPDDMLLQVLARLGCARAAANTSLLSRRWRGLWTRAPALAFHHIAPDRLLAAFARLARPVGSLAIFVPLHHSLSPAGASALLRAAAQLAPAKQLAFSVYVVRDAYGLAPPVELPCLESTTSAVLHVDQAFVVPPAAGVFTALESLCVGGNVVIDLDALLPRCPRLRKLRIRGWRSMTIKVHSPVMEELEVEAAVQLGYIDIVAPMLKKLRLNASIGMFYESTVSISAPQVEELSWRCRGQSTNNSFGVSWRLWTLELKTPAPYGHTQLANNSDITCSQQHCPCGDILSLSIGINHDIIGYIGGPFEQEISHIPARNLYALELELQTGGHVYGALLLDLLCLCNSIQKLQVVLNRYKETKECFVNCPCHQPVNWRSQVISLNGLKDIEIKGFKGEQHEVCLLKVLLSCATMLERVTLNLAYKVPRSCSAYMELPGMLKAYPSVKFNIYRWCGDEVLFA
ncbi:hypothetical protein ACP4OV_007352 [Aristida adscensionis]